MANYTEIDTVKTMWILSKDIPPALITKACQRAYNLINGVLSNRYSLPFVTTPPQIASISDDLTVFYLKRFLNPGTGDLSDESKNMYRDALQELKDIGEGRTSLVDSDNALVSVKETISSTTEDYTPIFNLDKWEDQDINADYLEVVEDMRS